MDPQNQKEVTAVGKFSYNQLVERIIGLKSSDNPEMVQQGNTFNISAFAY